MKIIRWTVKSNKGYVRDSIEGYTKSINKAILYNTKSDAFELMSSIKGYVWIEKVILNVDEIESYQFKR